jgi:hypothetical protein
VISDNCIYGEALYYLTYLPNDVIFHWGEVPELAARSLTTLGALDTGSGEGAGSGTATVEVDPSMFDNAVLLFMVRS